MFTENLNMWAASFIHPLRMKELNYESTKPPQD